MIRRYFLHTFFLAGLVIPSQASMAANAPSGGEKVAAANVDVTGVVTDSTTGQPLESAEVTIGNAGGAVVANTTTNTFGGFTIHNIGAGAYSISVHLIGYRPVTQPLSIAASASATQQLKFNLAPVGLNLETVRVVAPATVTVDTRSGDQVFKQNDFHGAPTVTTSQIIQQSIAGAARAPTGEVHIRGQHAEYTYYVDGVPVPPGISGSMNELFDPQVVNQINFQTGGWDAEYGGRNAAVVNVATKIPSGGFHGNFSGYGGGYSGSTVSGPTGSNGQSGTISGNSGPWGFFLSGARQFSNMRLEPVVIDPDTKLISNFHNDGTDYYGFGKLQYSPSAHDVVTLEGNLSTTKFAVPYDSSGGAFQNDHQNDANSFVNLGWHHQVGDPNQDGQTPGDFFGGLFYRHASLRYDPDARDDPQFAVLPRHKTPTTSPRIATANIFGLKADYAFRPGHETEFKFGTLSSLTNGHEDFSTFNATAHGSAVERPISTGHDIGVYGQTSYSPDGMGRVPRRAALRLTHRAGFAGTKPGEPAVPRELLSLDARRRPTCTTGGSSCRPTSKTCARSRARRRDGEAALPTLPERDISSRRARPAIPRGGSRRETLGVPQGEQSRHRRQHGTRLGDRHRRQHRARANHRHRGRARVATARTSLRLPQRGAQPRVRLRHDHRRLLPRRAAQSVIRSRPRPAAFDRRPARRTRRATFFLSGTAIYGSGLTNGSDPADCNCSHRPGAVRFQLAASTSRRARSSMRRRGMPCASVARSSAGAVRRQPVQQEVSAEGRVLQRAVGGPAAQLPASTEGSVLRSYSLSSWSRSTRPRMRLT